MARKLITDQRLSRREAFRLVGYPLGVAAGYPLVGGALVGLLGEPAGAQSATAPACVLTPALTEGPYFVDEKLNRSDIRTDPSDGTVSAGVPLQLKVIDPRLKAGGFSLTNYSFLSREASSRSLAGLQAALRIFSAAKRSAWPE